MWGYRMTRVRRRTPTGHVADDLNINERMRQAVRSHMTRLYLWSDCAMRRTSDLLPPSADRLPVLILERARVLK